MRILMMSQDGDGLGIAHRLAVEENHVDLFIKDKKFDKAGVGLINRVKEWRPVITKADLVICDMVGFGYLEETFRKFGKPVFSCNKMADILELDRNKGMELFDKFDIDIPETWEFDNTKDALDIVELWEDPGYVIKPNGNMDTSKTTVARHPETYRWALSQLGANDPLIVQKIIEGIEVSTEGWFNGRDWIKPFNHTFEEKRFLEGDLGPNTGCMGNVVIAKEKDRLIEATVMKLTPWLKKIGYRGPIDINCMVTEGKAYGLEATARLGYDAIEALLEGLREPATDLFFETAIGVKKTMDVGTDFMIAVRMSVPPWPHREPEEGEEGLPVLGLNEQNLKHLFLTDVYKEGDDYFYAGGDGVLLKATATGRDLREAIRRVYRTLDNINVSDKQYRQDIGARVESDMKILTDWGWL